MSVPTPTPQLQATLTLDTSTGSPLQGGVIPYLNSVAVGTVAAGPMTMAVPASGGTPAALPFASTPGAVPATAVYGLYLMHGSTVGTDPGIVVDMKNGAGNSSQVTLSPGGAMFFHNVSLALTGNSASDFLNWRVISASSATVLRVALVYT